MPAPQLNQPSSMPVLHRDGGRRQSAGKARTTFALDTCQQLPAEGWRGEQDTPTKPTRQGCSSREPSPKESKTALARHRGRSPRKPLPKASGTAFELAMWTRRHVHTHQASRRQAEVAESHAPQFSSNSLERDMHTTGLRSRDENVGTGFTAAFAACLVILSVMIALASPPCMLHGHM